MSWFHRRCESLEATLRARISDLEVSLDALREHHDAQMAEARAREIRLTDRVLAVRDPIAYAAISVNERAAARMPAVRRIGESPARTSRLPGSRKPAAGGTRPLLRPTDTGFRPVSSPPAEADAPKIPVPRQEIPAEAAAAFSAEPDDEELDFEDELDPPVGGEG